MWRKLVEIDMRSSIIRAVQNLLGQPTKVLSIMLLSLLDILREFVLIVISVVVHSQAIKGKKILSPNLSKTFGRVNRARSHQFQH